MITKKNLKETILSFRKAPPERLRVSIQLKHQIWNNLCISSPKAIQSVSQYLISIEAKDIFFSWLTPFAFAEIPYDKIEELSKHPGVVRVKPEPIMKTMDLKPAAINESENLTLSEVIEEVKANKLWNKATGKGVKIAIVDTGIDKTHPMFVKDGETKVIAENNFGDDEGVEDNVGHGTFCASCAAGYEWEVEGIGTFIGAAPDASLINVKISSGDKLYVSDAIEGIEWVIKPKDESGAGGADIFSCSWGGAFPVDELLELIRNVKKLTGSLFVFAIGNSGPAEGGVSFPGGFKEVISAGSIALRTPNYNGAAVFSSRGPGYHMATKPDFVSPAGNKYVKSDFEGEMGGEEQIYGAVPESVDVKRYIAWRGTSFACPVVAGIIACLLEAYPETEIIPAPNRVKNNHVGFGMIDAIELYNLLPVGNIVKKKKIRVLNYDPFIIEGTEGEWDEDGVTCPTPYIINNKLFVYYIDSIWPGHGIGVAIYNKDKEKFDKKGKVIDAIRAAPGIIKITETINGEEQIIYCAFYIKPTLDNKLGLYVSESEDGIIWSNEQLIKDEWGDRTPPAYRIGAVYHAGKIFLYCEDYYIIVTRERNNNEIVYSIEEEGKSIFIERREDGTYTTYQMCALFAPYCIHDGTNFQLYFSAPLTFRPWQMARAESKDGKKFDLKEIYTLNYQDYNHLMGLCTGAYLNGYFYYSSGEGILRVLKQIPSPKIYRISTTPP